MSEPQIILCPGQGAQAVSMGKGWFEASPEARATFDLADRLLGNRLGAPLSSLCFEGPAERLNQTDVSQPAIFVASIACWRALLAKAGATAADAPLAATAGRIHGARRRGCDHVRGRTRTRHPPRPRDAGCRRLPRSPRRRRRGHARPHRRNR